MQIASRVYPIAIFVSVMLAGCGGGTARETVPDDDAAVAAVERAQRQTTPPQPISLQPILFADIQKADLFGAGCVFRPGVNNAEPVMIAQSHEGYVKLAGEILTLAPDTGGPRLPLHTWQKYNGLAYSVVLSKASGEPVATGYETSDWPGHLSVRDEFGQPVYAADGIVQCGS